MCHDVSMSDMAFVVSAEVPLSSLRPGKEADGQAQSVELAPKASARSKHEEMGRATRGSSCTTALGFLAAVHKSVGTYLYTAADRLQPLKDVVLGISQSPLLSNSRNTSKEPL